MIHLMLSQRLLISLLFILPCLVAAAKSTCSFSCPPTDKLSQSLVKRPHAVGFDSFYSIFECMWVTKTEWSTSSKFWHTFESDTCRPTLICRIRLVATIKYVEPPSFFLCHSYIISLGISQDTGLQALGSIYDHCMPIAVACPTSDEEYSQSEPPLFSSQDKDEVPSWVEIGRYHLYLKEHNQ